MTNNKNICPCPNLDCPNHGDCEKCTSRHLRLKTLNYCAFYSILGELEAAVNASPDTEAARIIKNRIDRQTKVYIKCKSKYEITENQLNELRIRKSKLSEH